MQEPIEASNELRETTTQAKGLAWEMYQSSKADEIIKPKDDFTHVYLFSIPLEPPEDVNSINLDYGDTIFLDTLLVAFQRDGHEIISLESTPHVFSGILRNRPYRMYQLLYR